MIQATNVTKLYGTGSAQVRALREVELLVKPGEMISITGPSGCGKTTLLHVLAGIEPPSEGRVTIDGFDLYAAKEQERSRFRLANMGFVFQTYHLIPVLSAQENVALPLIGQGLSERQAFEEAIRALGQVGLADKVNVRPSQLSGGQNQRVAIARAIVARPKVIWADEPTGALDTGTSRQIEGLLRHINETTGTTVVLVTHDRDIAARTDRVVRMENGRVVKEVVPMSRQGAPSCAEGNR